MIKDRMLVSAALLCLLLILLAVVLFVFFVLTAESAPAPFLWDGDW